MTGAIIIGLLALSVVGVVLNEEYRSNKTKHDQDCECWYCEHGVKGHQQ